MTLIADGGSTKCDWVLLDNTGKIIFKTRTQGLNPAIVPPEELDHRIGSNPELQSVFETARQVDFYGAGCGTQTPRKILHEVIAQRFVNAQVNVQEDTVAAVHAVTHEPGIVCIFGTGSNSVYFDGKKISNNAESLGYILMDEASGNYFGKRLICDYFYKKMPSNLAKNFEKNFDLNPDNIKINLYKKPNPNAYLASFAEFIFKTEDENGYFYNLIREGVLKFIDTRILLYQESQSVPIHFIGSIAFFSKEIIEECLHQHQLKLGKIIRRPIDGLIEYYKKHKLNQG